MKILQDISTEELQSTLEEFYNCFETGFDFENFLKPFLESLGLSEVVVTSKSHDGGIDLTAVKNGLVEFDGSDVIKYVIQAKRYKPNGKTISPEKINALRGRLLTNEKGLFITTGRVSKNAKEEALTNDPSRPVIVIDGEDLITIMMNNEIGFNYKPVFSKLKLKEFLNETNEHEIVNGKDDETKDLVYRVVTSGEVRKCILAVPSSIFEKLENNDVKHSIEVTVSENKKYQLTLSVVGKYLADITDLYSDFEIKREDGTVTEKKIGWYTDGKTIELTIE